MSADYREGDVPASPPEKTDTPTPAGQALSDVGLSAISGKDATEARRPINADYAGKNYSFADKDPGLYAKYPEGVNFDESGYPDFSPYTLQEVQIDMKGNHTSDYKQANEAAGLEETPEGYTWHHHQDGKTMQLLPSDLHGSVRHTGGVSVVKHQEE